MILFLIYFFVNRIFLCLYGPGLIMYHLRTYDAAEFSKKTGFSVVQVSDPPL